MRNKTRENIRRKRRIKRKKRRVAFFRWLLFSIIALTIISFIAYISYRIYEGASYLYEEYVAMRASYIERKENQGVDIGKLNGYTNVLIMGIDDGVSVYGDEGLHADTIFFVSMDLNTGRLRAIAIPPDTYIDNREGSGRIATFYANGGSPRMVRAISDLLHVSIHQYITINTKAFRELIDALGGIDIYVEDDMNYEDEEGNISIHLKKGYQKLNGEAAEGFLRYRNTALSDMGRIQRQQKFMKALYQKLLQIDTVSKLPKVAEVFKSDVESSTEIFDSAHIANTIRKLSSDPPIIITLPGEYQAGERIWNPNYEETEEKLREFFPNINEAER